MAPMAPSTPEKEKDKNSDGILLVGTKEAVLAADEKIKEMVEALVCNFWGVFCPPPSHPLFHDV